MGNEAHVVLCVLEGPVPDGRVYTELTKADQLVVIEAVENWLDGLISTKRDLDEEELEPHEEYITEVATTLEKFREFRRTNEETDPCYRVD